jgi:hypothetical protein
MAIAKQHLCKHVPAATNTHMIMEELLDNRYTIIEKPWRQCFLCSPCRPAAEVGMSQSVVAQKPRM